MKRVPDNVIDEAVNLFLSGYTYNEIAEKLGVSLRTAYRYINEYTDTRKRNEIRAYKMYASGRSYTSIRNEVGNRIAYSVLYRITKNILVMMSKGASEHDIAKRMKFKSFTWIEKILNAYDDYIAGRELKFPLSRAVPNVVKRFRIEKWKHPVYRKIILDAVRSEFGIEKTLKLGTDGLFHTKECSRVKVRDATSNDIFDVIIDKRVHKCVPEINPEGAIIASVPVDRLKPIYTRSNFDNEYVEEISDNIIRGDVIPPIIVHYATDTNELIIADGHYRVEAYKKIGYDRVDAVIIFYDSIKKALEEAYITFAIRNSRNGKRLDSRDRFILSAKLRKYGYISGEISDFLSIPVSMVSSLISSEIADIVKALNSESEDSKIAIWKELIDSISAL